VINNYNKKNL